MDNDKTVLENDKTILENDKTVIEGQANQEPDTHISLKNWREFSVIEELSAEGGESDIFILEKDGVKQVLKLYRKGMSPKNEVLSQIKEISQKFPEHLIKALDFGYDQQLAKWYEILEYAKFGNLRQFLKDKKIDKDFLRKIIYELNSAIETLHKNDIIHRDLKPANVLVRNDNPLDLVFSDFGISSLIDSDLSKKMTTVKGTPIYSAPESFSGIMGKEVDYWALGMIIYEILAGKNPFAGLNIQTVMYKLTTENIDIPTDFDADISYLLKGLLVRKPKKRWGFNEIKRWLDGDKDIPVEVSEVEEGKKGGYQKPYTFRGKKYYSLEDLALAFIEDGESFTLAMSALGRGYVLKWLEDNGDYDKAGWLDALLQGAEKEAFVIRLVYSLHKDLPFSLYGEKITHEFIANTLKESLRTKLSENKDKIIALLDEGSLLKLFNEYLLQSKQSNSELNYFFENYKEIAKNSKNFEGLEIFLKLYDLINEDNKKYIIPNIIDNYNIFKKTIHLSDSEINEIKNLSLIETKELNKIKNNYVLPKVIINQINNILSLNFHAYNELKNLLIKLKTYHNIIYKVNFDKINDEYLLPDFDLNTSDDCFKVLDWIKNKSQLLKKDEFFDIKNNYILPQIIFNQLNQEQNKLK